ncbi:hypothetical protein [Microvirga sesbaniae]|uniref:hypothetical protein n=1 Tax=Microvirga sesbaniae TaxID=681392 RepID=UPI0021CAB428|nr:hypothetical protein [Microvirga sp. HBU67692]
MLDQPLARAALEEVADLHAFFEAWLGGRLDRTRAEFSRLENVLGDEFSMVSPGGAKLRRSDVTSWIWDAHGTRENTAGFRIVAVEPELLLLRPPLVVLRYVEEQEADGVVTRRWATAVFEVSAKAGGVRWLALQETWIPSSF